jgi:hypothetical protein
LFFLDCTSETVTWQLRTDRIVSKENLEREIQEMMMSVVLERCDRGRIIVAALTEFELGDAKNCCRRYTIAGYTQAIRCMADHVCILSLYGGMPFALK